MCLSPINSELGPPISIEFLHAGASLCLRRSYNSLLWHGQGSWRGFPQSVVLTEYSVVSFITQGLSGTAWLLKLAKGLIDIMLRSFTVRCNVTWIHSIIVSSLPLHIWCLPIVVYLLTGLCNNDHGENAMRG